MYYKMLRRRGANPLLQYMPFLALAVASYLVFKLLKFFKGTADTLGDTITDAALKASIQKTTNTSDSNYQRLERIAEQIHGYFHDSWDEDEDAVKRALQDVKTVTDVKILSTIYETKYDKSLKSDCDRYFNTFDWMGFPEVVKKNYF